MRTNAAAYNATHGALTRRTALARLAALVLGVAQATACAPSFLARALYPESQELDEDTVARVLRAFVLTVVPEAPEPDRVVRVFAEPIFRFGPFRRALVADLRRRTRELTGHDRFEQLDLEQRTRVMQTGLERGGVSARLCNGGIFLTQIVFFGGLWHERGACPLIGFEGPHNYEGPAALTYPQPELYLATSITTDGNPA